MTNPRSGPTPDLIWLIADMVWKARSTIERQRLESALGLVNRDFYEIEAALRAALLPCKRCREVRRLSFEYDKLRSAQMAADLDQAMFNAATTPCTCPVQESR